MKEKSILISEELHKKIKIFCAKKGISIKEYVKNNLEGGLQRLE